MGSQAPLMTAEELLRSDISIKSTELVRGVLADVSFVRGENAGGSGGAVISSWLPTSS